MSSNIKLDYKPHSLELVCKDHGFYWNKKQWALSDRAFQAFQTALKPECVNQELIFAVVPEYLLVGILSASPAALSLAYRPEEVSFEKLLQNALHRRHIDSNHRIEQQGQTFALSEELLQVLDAAVREARRQTAFYVSEHHLLVALCQTIPSIATAIAAYGITVSKIYDLIKTIRTSELKRFFDIPDEEIPYDLYHLTNTSLRTREANYKIVRLVEIGGMGVVYAAVRTTLDVDLSRIVVGDLIKNAPLHVYPVCLKFLKPDLLSQQKAYANAFIREIEVVKSLLHPNVVRIVDSGQTDVGLVYYVMEWIDGETLEERINRRSIPLADCVQILEHICSALTTAHARKILHLDVKPGNIMISDDGTDFDVKVIDFGLAKVASEVGITTTLTQLGWTEKYCAPEVFAGRGSHLSDVYSLGATLYVLLTGVVPFGTSYVYAKQHPARELPDLPTIIAQRPELPDGVDDVIRKALQRDPHHRQPSAQAFLEEFKSVVLKDKAAI